MACGRRRRSPGDSRWGRGRRARRRSALRRPTARRPRAGGRGHGVNAPPGLRPHMGQRGAFLLHLQVPPVGDPRSGDQPEPDADLDAIGGGKLPKLALACRMVDDPVEDQERRQRPEPGHDRARLDGNVELALAATSTTDPSATMIVSSQIQRLLVKVCHPVVLLRRSQPPVGSVPLTVPPNHLKKNRKMNNAIRATPDDLVGAAQTADVEVHWLVPPKFDGACGFRPPLRRRRDRNCRTSSPPRALSSARRAPPRPSVRLNASGARARAWRRRPAHRRRAFVAHRLPGAGQDRDGPRERQPRSRAQRSGVVGPLEQPHQRGYHRDKPEQRAPHRGSDRQRRAALGEGAHAQAERGRAAAISSATAGPKVSQASSLPAGLHTTARTAR